MDEIRYSRLESRVDEIKDDLSEVKAEQKITNHNIEDLKSHMISHTESVKNHVAGDDKIIAQLLPIIDEFKFEKERKRRRLESLKAWGIRLGIPSILVGIIGGIVKIWISF